MKQIIVTINPHEDGVRCGECQVKIGRLQACAWSEQREVGEWFGAPGDATRWRKQEQFRGPECKEREALSAALVKALKEAQGGHGSSRGMSEIWTP